MENIIILIQFSDLAHMSENMSDSSSIIDDAVSVGDNDDNDYEKRKVDENDNLEEDKEDNDDVERKSDSDKDDSDENLDKNENGDNVDAKPYFILSNPV